MADLFDPREVTEDEVDAAWVGLWAHSELLGRNEGSVLAFDLGTVFAWCLLESGVPAMSGWLETARKGEGGSTRLFRFRTAMQELLDHAKPTVVAYEKPALRSSTSTWAVKMAGLLETECEARSLPYTSVAPNTLKKWATGHGGSSKEAMRACLIIRMDGP